MEKRQESLIEHLEALRSTLIKCFAALGIGLLPMFLAAPDCIDLLIRIMTSGNNISLNYFLPMEVFVLQIKTAVVLDILICSPYIAKNIWEFVLPALHDNERRFIRSIVLSSCILFIFGALFCVFFILPLLINFGLSFATPNIRAVFGVSGIISTALWLSVVFGLDLYFLQWYLRFRCFMIFFVVQTLKMGELLTVYGLSGLSMLVIQGLKQVVKF